VSRLFTSESVTEGHPDKICDAISDSILDALLAEDPRSRVAVETLVTTGQVHVAGEVTTSAYADIPRIVREKVLEIGYDSSAKGFDGNSCGVNIAIGAQSPDIAQGVDTSHEARVGGTDDEIAKQGAGDQGLMFGYATTDTPELMPLPIALAHRLSRKLTEVRKNGVLPYLRPDGKTQVTIEYDGDRPVRLDTVVISTQHAADIDLDNLLAPDIREKVVDAVLADLDLPSPLDTSDIRLLVNPTGKFVLGGIVLILIGLSTFTMLGANTSYWLICGSLFVQGLGMGMTMMPIMSAALATLSNPQVPDGSTLMNAIQQAATSIGTAVISVILASSLASKPEAGLAIMANTSDKPLPPGVPNPLPESFFDTAADVFSNTFVISVVLICLHPHPGVLPAAHPARRDPGRGRADARALSAADADRRSRFVRGRRSAFHQP